MEDVFQKYKGKVSFVWVYGSEAHPEEYPFASGYESKDLGWTHPYTISRSMEERAQRAKWIKAELKPPGQIPMMIDYINHEGAKNNAIRKAYLGGGFYSGYVIDCDGKVLDANAWAWFAPGKDWWGLPLRPVAALESLLDNYLANPPACYNASATLPSPSEPPATPPAPGEPPASEPPTTSEPPPASSPPAAAAPHEGPGESSSSGCGLAGSAEAAPSWWLSLIALGIGCRRRRDRAP